MFPDTIFVSSIFQPLCSVCIPDVPRFLSNGQSCLRARACGRDAGEVTWHFIGNGMMHRCMQHLRSNDTRNIVCGVSSNTTADFVLRMCYCCCGTQEAGFFVFNLDRRPFWAFEELSEDRLCRWCPMSHMMGLQEHALLHWTIHPARGYYL